MIWFVLGFVVGNTEISNVFSLTYPMQFVANIIYLIFGTGANIKAEKENNKNATSSVFLFGGTLSFVIFLLASIFARGYITYFGFDVETFLPYVVYFFGFMFVQNLFYILMEKLYLMTKKKMLLFTLLCSMH